VLCRDHAEESERRNVQVRACFMMYCWLLKGIFSTLAVAFNGKGFEGFGRFDGVPSKHKMLNVAMFRCVRVF
jgi:hypothetical protein